MSCTRALHGITPAKNFSPARGEKVKPASLNLAKNFICKAGPDIQNNARNILIAKILHLMVVFF